jgi:hypothetical protein
MVTATKNHKNDGRTISHEINYGLIVVTHAQLHKDSWTVKCQSEVRR